MFAQLRVIDELQTRMAFPGTREKKYKFDWIWWFVFTDNPLKSIRLVFLAAERNFYFLCPKVG